MKTSTFYTYEDDYGTEGQAAAPTLAEAKRAAKASAEEMARSVDVTRTCAGGDDLRRLVAAVFNHAGYSIKSELVGTWVVVNTYDEGTEEYTTSAPRWEATKAILNEAESVDLPRGFGRD